MCGALCQMPRATGTKLLALNVSGSTDTELFHGVGIVSIGESGPGVRQRRRENLGQRPTFLRACFGCGGKQSVRNEPDNTLIRKDAFPYQ
jgi:hypothetical protein